jgi:DNA-3-methyladenine glycosylase
MALGITVRHSGESLQGNAIWLEQGVALRPEQVVATKRVGVEYAGADAKRPWRFRVRASAWTSLAK